MDNRRPANLSGQSQQLAGMPNKPDDPLAAAWRNGEVIPPPGPTIVSAGPPVGGGMHAVRVNPPSSVAATPFVWCEPAEIPKRQWLYGRHLIRRNVSVTVAPGGVGKSSLTVVQALELAAGRAVLGQTVPQPARVWLFNLEDDPTEMRRRISAAMQLHRISESEVAGRLFVDSGREQELILAEQKRDELSLNELLIKSLQEQLENNRIDVLIVDPFVSSHRVNEMDNGKIDIIAKQLVKLSERCNCSIELVHHTRKLNGADVTSDASRGASSLVNAARSARVLQRASDKELDEWGVRGDGCSYFSVKRDKSNLASAGTREPYRLVPVDLGQGDQVGVVEQWKEPDPFDGLSSRDLKKVQHAIDGKKLRFDSQVKMNWAGETIAETLGLDPERDKGRIKQLINGWLKSGALTKETVKLSNGKESPVLAVGEWAT